jgi:outer membrane lipoprotein carrier protein
MKTDKVIFKTTLVLWICVFPLITARAQEATPEKEKPELAAPADLSLDEVILKLQENYQAINTYRTGFDQELYSMTQGRVITRGAGEVIYKKPGKMVWTYREPDEHLYITRGNTIWDYSPKDKEVYVLSIKDALYKSFLLGLGDLKKDFEVSFHAGRKMNPEGLYQLDLVPRSKAEREAIGAITIYVDPADFLVKRTEMEDALGNRNKIRFKDMKKNPELADKLFKFEPPTGVKVIRAEDAVPASP